MEHYVITYLPKMDHKICNSKQINRLELQTVDVTVKTNVAGYLQLDHTATQNIVSCAAWKQAYVSIVLLCMSLVPCDSELTVEYVASSLRF
jgi:hypothetical protein